jgi:hypothetical protein
MDKTVVNALIEQINHNPSEYEEKYIRWVSIGYDKDKLKDLLYELQYHKEQEIQDEKRIEILEEILGQYDVEHLSNLLKNEPNTVRLAMIEKYARIAAMEMLIEGKYTIETLNTITQFPLGDYQLIVKRIQELVALISDITAQSSTLIDGMPGV